MFSFTFNIHFPFFFKSVFDSVPIPYPKREFITDDDNSDAAGGAHISKTEPAVVIKTEAPSVVLNQQQQQSSHVTHNQQQSNVHIKQQSQQQHNNIVQQTHAQQVR